MVVRGKAGCTIEDYDEERREYRLQSNLLAAALLAHATGKHSAFVALKKAMQKGKFVGSRRGAGGAWVNPSSCNFSRTLRQKRGRGRDRAEPSPARHRRTLPTLANEFADCLAFLTIIDPEAKDTDYRAYPQLNAVVVQDSHNLTTTVTVDHAGEGGSARKCSPRPSIR